MRDEFRLGSDSASPFASRRFLSTIARLLLACAKSAREAEGRGLGWGQRELAPEFLALWFNRQSPPCSRWLSTARTDAGLGANRVFARQMAMYLAHVGCGVSLTEVGHLFERDRTTVAHACGLVEDRRDDPDFDHRLNHLERAVSCLLDAL